MPKLLKTTADIDSNWLKYSTSISKSSVLLLVKLIVIDYVTEVVGFNFHDYIKFDYAAGHGTIDEKELLNDGFSFVGAIGEQVNDEHQSFRIFTFFKNGTSIYCFYHLLQNDRISVSCIFIEWENGCPIDKAYIKLKEFKNQGSIQYK